MKQALDDIFNTLRDSSEALGVGLVDENGLVVQSAGDHGGKRVDELVPLMLAFYPPQLARLEQFLEDAMSEHIAMGRNHCFYMVRMRRRYVLYVLTTGPNSKARPALRRARADLLPLLRDDGLLTTPGD
ncbi:MAG: hypothetical protein U5L04_04185 [Trueperaceae bacterium]|nr:hypothetical protein [Trueperaceae bacterium]